MPGFGLIQPMHLVLILLIVLVVFGAGKLSQVGGALGQSVKEFKQNVAEEDDETQPKTLASEAEPVATEASATKVVRPSEEGAVTVVRTTERPATSLRREEI